ncbi:hypothetical protein IQ288_34725 [Burkholderia sp. R-69980]|nr:hypothetical protein [Burkholderia sp. R-69980]
MSHESGTIAEDENSIMFNSRVLLALMSATLFAGCAVHRPVDLSDSKGIVVARTSEKLRTVADVAVINKAADAKQEHHFFGADQVPINPEERTAVTVTNDLKDYFSSHLAKDRDGRRAIRVTIEQAEAYWTLRGAVKVPIVGLFALAGDDSFHLKTVLRIEVEEVGKPTRTYVYDQTTEIPDGSANLPSDIDRTYQRLIAKSRRQLVETLDKDFLPDYVAQ